MDLKLGASTRMPAEPVRFQKVVIPFCAQVWNVESGGLCGSGAHCFSSICLAGLEACLKAFSSSMLAEGRNASHCVCGTVPLVDH